MLFFAAAILYSSVHVLGVAGPLVLPENTSSEVTSSVAASASLDDASPRLTSPIEGVPARLSPLKACGAELGRAGAATRDGRFSAPECLAQLGSASPRQLHVFAESLNDDASEDVTFATRLGQKGSALATRSWWTELSSDHRADLTTALPGMVGNLEGVPYTVRDLANRMTLTSTLGRLEQRRTQAEAGLPGLDSEASRLIMLQQVSLALTRGREGDDSDRELVSLDTVFPGLAAISVGDLDTAKNVSVMVPGMLYTVSNQITFWTDRAAALHSEQDFWSSTLATTDSNAGSSATVAWMGYRTPGLTNVLGLGLAKVGAVHLQDTVLGLNAVRSGSQPRLTIIAHSYGSTAATIALSSGRIHVNSFVALGSPGSVVPEAVDLRVTRGSVYAAAAALDPVAGSGVFGTDPGSSVFGATRLSVAAGTDPFTEQHLSGTLSHNSYFVPGSQSMRNLALIGIGRGSLADGHPPQPEQPQPVNGPSLALVRPQDVYRD